MEAIFLVVGVKPFLAGFYAVFGDDIHRRSIYAL